MARTGRSWSWTSGPTPSFEAFFQQERSNIEPIMAAVGATGEPEVTFWRKLETGDDVGSN
jgi:hypothetical protein